jgi:hypothetical protein
VIQVSSIFIQIWQFSSVSEAFADALYLKHDLLFLYQEIDAQRQRRNWQHGGHLICQANDLMADKFVELGLRYVPET